MDQRPHDHYQWISALRALATVSVILLHVSADSLYTFQSYPDLTWWTGNCYDSLVRFCVPVFVMITGALLLPLREGWVVFYRKRFFRLLFPFALWSAVYIFLNARHEQFDDTHRFPTWLWQQLSGESCYHLWYIYMIMGIYLLLPLIHEVVKRISHAALSVLLLAWIVSLPLVNYNDHFFPGFIGYLLMGYYLKEYRVSNPKVVRTISILLFTAAVLVTITGTYLLSESKKQFDERLYSYLGINVFAASSAVFIFFRIKTSLQELPYVVSLINRHSYGIYLSHVFVLLMMSKAGIYYNRIIPLIGIPVVTLICLAASTLITVAISRLPFGRYISG